MLVLITAAMLWVARHWLATRRQTAAVQAVRALHGHVEYQHEAAGAAPLPGPDALRFLIGDEHYVTVTSVYLGNAQATDAALVPLAGLTGLEELTICTSPFTGAGLVHLRRSGQLRLLCLNELPIEDGNLEHLGAFGRLQELYLARTPINGSGLVHLRHVPLLKAINLSDTRIDDDDLPHLLPLAGLEWLNLDGTAIEDPAIEVLAKLPRLRELSVCRTRLSLPAVERLRHSLPGAQVHFNAGPPQGP